MSKDVIYRETAVDAINEWLKLNRFPAFGEGILYLVPSADRPPGQWIVDISNYESVCSICGASEADFIYGTEIWYGLGKSNFCPNCGARMKGVNNEPSQQKL